MLIGGNTTHLIQRMRPCLRTLIATALVVALLATLVPASAQAADLTIDTTRNNGSITIYKYENAQASNLGDNPTQEEMKNWIDNYENNYGEALVPLEDVVFTYLRVGGIAQNSDGGEVQIGYSIEDSTLLGLLQGAGLGSPAFEESGIDYYNVSDLNTALGNLSRTTLESFITSASGNVAMTATDSSGYTTTGNSLTVGLYLIVETGYPATVSSTTRPFFVSIPMTDYDENGDMSWIYNVTVYPKNDTDDIEIDKSVVDDDGNETKVVDGEIGQAKTFVIRADVPSAIRDLTTYTITDTLSAGLTFDSSYTPVVEGIFEDGTSETLTAGTEYTFGQDSTDPQILRFVFDPDELEAIDQDTGETVREYAQIKITYQAYLNENAVVGTTYTNGVELEYGTSTGTNSTTPPSNPGIVTYGIDLTKIGDGDTNNLLSDVTFKLYRTSVTADNEIEVAYNNTDGYYYVISDSLGVQDEDKTELTTIEGKLYIKGLESGTYYLVETETQDGYNLLQNPIEIVITSNEGSNYISYEDRNDYSDLTDDMFTFLQVSSTNETYYLDSECTIEFDLSNYTIGENGLWINFGRTEVYNSEGQPVSPMYAAGPISYSATVGGADATMDGGSITITVNNQSGFDLPTTGGQMMPYVIVGIVIVAVAATSIYLITRKKDKNGNEA